MNEARIAESQLQTRVVSGA